MNAFKVVQCPKCGNAQVTQSLKSLKCKYCQRSTTIKSAKLGFNLNIINSFEKGSDAARFVAAYKLK